MILESILAFVGLLVGALLAFFTRDELKSGKKYFILIYRILLFILIIYLLYLSEVSWWLFGLVLGFLFTLTFSDLYLYLGLATFSVMNVYASFLVFLIGLPYGTLLFGRRNLKRYIIYSFFLFFIPALILLVQIPETFLYSFVAGGLFSLFLRKIQ